MNRPLEGEVITKDAGGRPSKYIEGMAECALSWYKKGLCTTEVCAELNISKKTMKRWYDKYLDFADAVDLGETLYEAEVINKQRDMAEGKAKCANALLQMNLNKNTIGWDKSESSNNGSVNIQNLQINQLSSKELDKLIEEKEAQYSKVRLFKEEVEELEDDGP